MAEYSEFATRLRKLRDDLKITQQQLADKIGISKSSMAMYETGKREPNLLIIKKMCEILNTNGNYLLGIEENTGSDNFIPNEKEKELIMKYRQLTDEGKQYAEQTLNLAYNTWRIGMAFDNHDTRITEEEKDNNLKTS